MRLFHVSEEPDIARFHPRLPDRRCRPCIDLELVALPHGVRTEATRVKEETNGHSIHP